MTPTSSSIEVVDLDDDDNGDNETAEIIWNEQLSTNWIRQEIRAQLSPDEPAVDGIPQMPRPYYDVLDVSREDTALVEEWFKGDRKRWVIPYTVGDNKVTISPATRWVEVREAMVAASDDFEKRSFGSLVGRLGDELQKAFGDEGGRFQIDQVTTDGRFTVRNTADSSVFMGEFVEIGSRVLLSGTSDWERIKAPEPKKQSSRNDVATSLMFDDTPEGRVAAARQRRRQMLSPQSR